MVAQNSSEPKEVLKNIEDEISALYSLGVEDYEIRYLISLKNNREEYIRQGS